MFRKLGLGVCIVFAASSLFAANKERKTFGNFRNRHAGSDGGTRQHPRKNSRKKPSVLLFSRPS